MNQTTGSLKKIPPLTIGKALVEVLPLMVSKYGERIIWVTGGNSFNESLWGNKIKALMPQLSSQWQWIQVSGEPQVDWMQERIDALRSRKPWDLVVAIGGGSVLDVGKGLSAMMLVSDPLKAYLEGVGYLNHPGTKIPFVAVPTTSGTGSEVTANAVFGQIGPDGYKKSLRHEGLIPDEVIIDGDLLLTCPLHVTAQSSMDALTQLVEAYLSNKANMITDALCLHGLRLFQKSFYRLFHGEEKNSEVRIQMAMAATLSGIGLLNAGLGTVHGMASTIGGKASIPHGLICGRLMRPINEMMIEYVLKEPEKYGTTLGKYETMTAIFCPDKPKQEIQQWIACLKNFESMSELANLSDQNVSREDWLQWAADSGDKNNPLVLSPSDRQRAMMKALKG